MTIQTFSLTFDNFAFAIRLTRLYEIGARCIELETVRLMPVAGFPDLNVFQWDDPPGFFVCGVLKIVKAIVI